MKKRISFGFTLLAFCSLLFLSGCPYQSRTMGPKYWDDSMKETVEDIDDVFGARSYN